MHFRLINKSKFIYHIAIIFFLFQLCFIFTTPPFEAPDENHHLNYINFISKNISLPNQEQTETLLKGEGHQNPLYYIIAAGLTRLLLEDNIIDYRLIPNTNHIWYGGDKYNVPLFVHINVFEKYSDRIVFYMLRIFTALFSLVTVIMFYKTLLLLENSNNISILTIILITNIPEFIFISGMINNDSLALMFISLSVYNFAKAINNSSDKLSLYLSYLYLALSVLTKFYALILFFVFSFYLVFIKTNRNTKINITIVASISLFIVIILPLLLWKFIYYENFIRASILETDQNLWALNFQEFLGQIIFFFQSFFGKFGWANVTLPFYIYGAYLIIWGIILINSIRKIDFSNGMILFSIIAIFSLILEIIYFNSYTLQMQGRYFFPALSFISIISYYGIKSISAKISYRSMNIIIIGIYSLTIYSVIWNAIFYR